MLEIKGFGNTFVSSNLSNSCEVEALAPLFTDLLRGEGHDVTIYYLQSLDQYSESIHEIILNFTDYRLLLLRVVLASFSSRRFIFVKALNDQVHSFNFPNLGVIGHEGVL